MRNSRQNLTEIRDESAYGELRSLLWNAVNELHALQIEPVVVASCPFKFNDAFNDEGWEAIQVGTFFSERTSYLGTPDAHDQRLAETPAAGTSANRILQTLEAAQWRKVYQKVFGRSSMSTEEVIALVLQDGKNWLAVDGSNSGESAVYSIESGGGLRHFGHAVSDDEGRRFDQRIGENQPLLIRTNQENIAGRAAIEARLSALERSPSGERPSWAGPVWTMVKRQHALPEPPSLFERLRALAQTGRVTHEEYFSIWSKIRLNNVD
jgi:hypothetical protein